MEHKYYKQTIVSRCKILISISCKVEIILSLQLVEVDVWSNLGTEQSLLYLFYKNSRPTTPMWKGN